MKVLGLADDHLVGADQPVKWNLPGGMESLLSSDGTVTTLADLPRNATYSVQVYDPAPTIDELNSAGRDFPSLIRGQTVINGLTIPIWPAKLPAHTTPLAPEFMQASNQAWTNSHARQAKTEYGAVVALENYFRSAPFKYTLTPHLPNALPPLAEFMLQAHRGYCQMFSGAMALALRMHGIPARVAVGFTQGKLTGRRHVPRQRPRRPRLGRGLLPRLRLAAVRADAGRTRADRHVDLQPQLREDDDRRRRTQHPVRGSARSSDIRGSGRRPCRKASPGTGDPAATPTPTPEAGSCSAAAARARTAAS